MRPHMLKSPHQSIHRCAASRLRRILLQPLAESGIERLTPRPRYQSGLFDQALFRAEGYVFHTTIVYTKAVRTREFN